MAAPSSSFLLPLIWSLPTALMIGELASAIPAEGGFYVWVRRAMGPFWGYQEGWLSLSASIFDMAIYPVFFVIVPGQVQPRSYRRLAWIRLVAGGGGALLCVESARALGPSGEDSVWMSALLLAPFAVLRRCWDSGTGTRLHAMVQWRGPGSDSALSTAILVAMWNYMGWDNASTVAQEVENPQRAYPRAMVAATAVVTITYVLPLAAIAVAGFSVDKFSTGDWTSAAALLGGRLLGMAIAAGGMITGVGMFNALVMSYTRLPMAMAEDGMLPRVIARRNGRGVPWVSVLLCGLAWALALNLKFEKLITIDLVLYGSSLLLEFIALVVLRIREPNLPRPFKAGNLALAVSLGVGPAALIAYALYASRADAVKMGHTSISALLFSIVVGLLGPLLYWLTAMPRARRLAAEPIADS